MTPLIINCKDNKNSKELNSWKIEATVNNNKIETIFFNDNLELTNLLNFLREKNDKKIKILGQQFIHIK